jgi:hypothetical protein
MQNKLFYTKKNGHFCIGPYTQKKKKIGYDANRIRTCAGEAQ